LKERMTGFARYALRFLPPIVVGERRFLGNWTKSGDCGRRASCVAYGLNARVIPNRTTGKVAKVQSRRGDGTGADNAERTMGSIRLFGGAR